MASLTVLYDADCGVCTALARWVERAGRDVAVAPIGSTLGARLLRDLEPEARLAGMHAVDRLGRRRTGAAAVPDVLRVLPAGGLAARVAEALPGLTAVGYATLAAHRRRISRTLGLEACAVSPDAGEKPWQAEAGHARVEGPLQAETTVARSYPRLAGGGAVRYTRPPFPPDGAPGRNFRT